MPVQQTVQVPAPAKINLALHITGQRDDGYHLLDSLVGFAEIGDTLTISAPARSGLSVSGAFAESVPTDKSNFIFKVAERAWPDMDISFHLHKELPVASGIGGGSADAAACYRGIAMLRRLLDPEDSSFLMSDYKVAALVDLGADIPMCVRSEFVQVQGIGEQVRALKNMPALPAVLVNPGVPVSTPAVFKSLTFKSNSPMSPCPEEPDAQALICWLAEQRNDLQRPACAVAPDIQTVLDALIDQEGCRLARMSGSGATCFGLFHSSVHAHAAEQCLRSTNPTWWVRASTINGPSHAAPYLMRSTT